MIRLLDLMVNPALNDFSESPSTTTMYDPRAYVAKRAVYVISRISINTMVITMRMYDDSRWLTMIHKREEYKVLYIIYTDFTYIGCLYIISKLRSHYVLYTGRPPYTISGALAFLPKFGKWFSCRPRILGVYTCLSRLGSRWIYMISLCSGSSKALRKSGHVHESSF